MKNTIDNYLIELKNELKGSDKAIIQDALADSHEDEIMATLQSAMDAYGDGDIQYALEELAYAQQLLNGLVAEGLQGFQSRSKSESTIFIA